MKGVAIGAGMMYFLDPTQGKRRQQDVLSNLNGFADKRKRALDVMQRDFSNRARGFACEVRGRINSEDPSDSLLEQRVRSTIGRVVSNSSAVVVIAEQGVVTLAGQVMKGELDELVAVTHMVGGVREVRHELELTDGEPEAPTSIPRLNPAESLVAVGAGTLMVFAGIMRGGLFGPLLKVGGIALAVKGFVDTEERFQKPSNPE